MIIIIVPSEGDPLPGAGDEGNGASGQVDAVDGALCHVAQQHSLPSTTFVW